MLLLQTTYPDITPPVWWVGHWWPNGGSHRHQWPTHWWLKGSSHCHRGATVCYLGDSPLIFWDSLLTQLDLAKQLSVNNIISTDDLNSDPD